MSEIAKAIAAITQFERQHGKPITEYEVTPEQFEQLKTELSALTSRHDPLYQPIGDTIMGVKIRVIDYKKECERLRGELEEAKATRGNSVLVPSDELKRMQEQLAAQAATIEKLRIALNKCADKFHDYAEIHSMKEQTSENIEKIERNLEMARMADEALAATQDDAAILRSRDAQLIAHLNEVVKMPDEVFIRLRELAAKIRNGAQP